MTDPFVCCKCGMLRDPALYAHMLGDGPLCTVCNLRRRSGKLGAKASP